MAGHAGYPLTVHGIDERAKVALVDDRNHARLTAPLDALAAARARIGSYRHRLLVLDAPPPSSTWTPCGPRWGHPARALRPS